MTFRDHIWTVVFATLFAVLIWLWAEGENRGQRSDTLQVMFRSDGTGDFVIHVRDPNGPATLRGTVTVQLTLEGPTQALDRVMRNRQPVILPVSDATDDRERTVSVLAELQRLDRFQAEGITIQRAEPAMVSIHISEMVRIPVAVETEIEGYEFDSITVTPESVHVRLPRSLWQSLVQPQFGESFVHLGLSPAALRRITPAEPATLQSVPLRLDDRLQHFESIEIEPAVVSVELTLANRLFETTAPAIIKLGILPRDSLMYRVEFDNDQYEHLQVLVTGSAEAIGLVESREVVIVGWLNLTSDELEQGVTSKQVEWGVPRGLDLEVQQEAPVIPIRIERRSGE